ncbi:hypothetical protein JCM19037_1683 [Geomicrobium sp. JCM 19037]|uniref:hypothetical protein n=1 Tax=unclassified Geomicrobium TaxID=2628951 RepID=UPI00045F1F33|nr:MULTISPECIES: hypothetical protein [unclassified Geomicrobium]GAK03363.1 hypothetical protein JCM19037_1683 [Geomicrobium sp. JCM 19037]GAK12769.1 hypothetical protein JCM19039_2568 [Geomicrobium sp. JCM 19039]
MNPNPYLKYLVETFLRGMENFFSSETTYRERRQARKKRKLRMFTMFGLIPTAMKISYRRAKKKPGARLILAGKRGK